MGGKAEGTSYFHVHSAGWTVPVAFALGASLGLVGLGLGPTGSAGSGYGRSTDSQTGLFFVIWLAVPSLSPRLPRMESSLGPVKPVDDEFPTVIFLASASNDPDS